jgi:hypothetical protein
MTMLCRKPFSMAVFVGTLIPYLIVLFALNVQLLRAAPGAHGPDGEHLATETRQQLSMRPRFEAFSDAFELVGELQPNALILHLHDYQTNRPVADAKIELETANLSSTAHFVADKNHYLLDDQQLLATLQLHDNHEMVLTIISSDNADLLTASLDLSATTNHDDAAHQHHHQHFPWWTLPVGLLLFIAGMLFGRRGAGK